MRRLIRVLMMDLRISDCKSPRGVTVKGNKIRKVPGGLEARKPGGLKARMLGSREAGKLGG
jgi:hypothetical protein